MNDKIETLTQRLLKRAEIRRQISTRKSVQENKPDRISDLLEEAAKQIELLESIHDPLYKFPFLKDAILSVVCYNGLNSRFENFERNYHLKMVPLIHVYNPCNLAIWDDFLSKLNADDLLEFLDGDNDASQNLENEIVGVKDGESLIDLLDHIILSFD